MMNATLEVEVQDCLATWWLEQSVANYMMTGQQSPYLTREELWASPIGQMLQVLLRAGLHQLDRKDSTNLNLVQGCFDTILQIFFKSATAPAMSDSLWSSIIHTPIGRALFLADLWIDRDELVSLQQIQMWTGFTLRDLSRKITRGKIVRYLDPRQSNPTYATRIRYRDVYYLTHRDGMKDNRNSELVQAGIDIERRYLAMTGGPVILDFDPRIWLKEQVRAVVHANGALSYNMYPFREENYDLSES